MKKRGEEINFKDCKVGDYTHRVYNTIHTLNKIISIKSDTLHTVFSIDVKYRVFNTNIQASNTDGLKSLYKATPKQIHWVNKCIEANKYIPELIALQDFNENTELNFTRY